VYKIYNYYARYTYLCKFLLRLQADVCQRWHLSSKWILRVSVSRADVCSTEGYQLLSMEFASYHWRLDLSATYVSVHILALCWQISCQAPSYQISKQSDQTFPNAYVRTDKYGEANWRILLLSSLWYFHVSQAQSHVVIR